MDEFYIGILFAIALGMLLLSYLRNLVYLNVSANSAFALYTSMLKALLGAKSVFFD
jgi:hypothetical protein